ncbi:MAG: hypothetical protein A3I66_18155 [Burkholderiales bacterium RIFCSPLOWO2_02_FULL_57_36]|nr:MAG: hypothetical protein A3I66_18155 [Burkholderiales bacterium RIFCSPLOWO2_02_FULL_57_36]
MSKNILIFSDGTGQAGGLKPDQTLSNVYKFFRASRVSPDNSIDPANQIAFYDAGLGTENDGGSIPFRPIQKFRKFWSAATGTGISRNIADCYEAILKHYEPGDRIFLFGFSRGAYTARCVGGVMALCGIPTKGADGGPLPKFGRALRTIADEAVAQVYEHGSGSDKPQRKEERLEKARRFREKYGSDDNGQANEVPYFIGVFDTVAALGASGLRRLGMLAALAISVALLAALIAGVLALFPWVKFVPAFSVIQVLIASCVAIGGFRASFKIISDYPVKGKSKWHFAAWHLRFYDNSLNTRVRFARHALAIDESRADFKRVPWANKSSARPRVPGEPEWLQQIWFAGNHSDIGGSYPEDEARLSDVSLQWMVEQAASLPHPVLLDSSKLNLFPSSGGMQHSEVESLRDLYRWWVPRPFRRLWKEKPRDIKPDAPLHPTVLERFSLAGVSHYGLRTPYRPGNLSGHSQVQHYYAEHRDVS